MNSPSDPDLVQLYRFARVITGDADAAFDITEKAISQGKTERYRDTDEYMVALFRRVRKACLERFPTSSDSTPPDSPIQSSEDLAKYIRSYPEPTRSVAALFYLNALPYDHLRNLLGLSLIELGEQIDKVRASLRDLINTNHNVEQ